MEGYFENLEGHVLKNNEEEEINNNIKHMLTPN